MKLARRLHHRKNSTLQNAFASRTATVSTSARTCEGDTSPVLSAWPQTYEAHRIEQKTDDKPKCEGRRIGRDAKLRQTLTSTFTGKSALQNFFFSDKAPTEKGLT